MLRVATFVSLVAAVAATAASAGDDAAPAGQTPSPLAFSLQSIEGEQIELSKFKGKVVVFVNVASECGFTKQYKDLQALHEKYTDKGLVIIGVPANEFGGQEPGSNAEIMDFCKTTYGVEFPMMAKTVVQGVGTNPLYAYLTSDKTGLEDTGPVKWNFEKFVVGRDGKVLARFRSKVTPTDPEFIKVVEAELAKEPASS